MKKILFLILIMILFSCDKELSITGEWNVTFITHPTGGTNTYDGLLSIVQNGNKLTGSFDWGGAARPLLTDSNVNDTVSIYWENIRFSGTINKASDLMSGGVYNYEAVIAKAYVKYGTWQAIKK